MINIIRASRVRRDTRLFISVWDTRNVQAGDSDSFSIRLPLYHRQGLDVDVDWGDGTGWHEGYTSMPEYTYAEEGIYTIRVKGRVNAVGFGYMGIDRFKILRIESWGRDITYENSLANQNRAFEGCMNLTRIGPDCEWMNSIDKFVETYLNSRLELLPDALTLETANWMNRMFEGNNLTHLPVNMSLDNLVYGRRAFMNNNIEFLREIMTLPNLENGERMFYNNEITSISSQMSLPNLTNGDRMFEGNTINTEDYSGLLVRMNRDNNNHNVTFHGGFSKYNSTAIDAVNELVNTKGWTIIDGGLDPNA